MWKNKVSGLAHQSRSKIAPQLQTGVHFSKPRTYLLPSHLVSQIGCSEPFSHCVKPVPLLSSLSADEITFYFTEILEAVCSELSTSLLADSRFIFIFTHFLLIPLPCFRVWCPWRVGSIYPSSGFHALQTFWWRAGVFRHLPPPTFVSLISPPPLALSCQVKIGLKRSFPKNTFPWPIFSFLRPPYLSLSSCNCLISEKAACVLFCQTLCKDHLDCPCFPERQQELWNQTAWVQPKERKPGLIATLLRTGKNDHCLGVASSCSDFHRPAVYTGSTWGRHLICSFFHIRACVWNKDLSFLGKSAELNMLLRRMTYGFEI